MENEINENQVQESADPFAPEQTAAPTVAPATASAFNEEEIVATESSSFDVSAFKGQRVLIESMELSEVPDYYVDGNYDPSSTEKKHIVEIKTAPLKKAEKLPDGTIKFTDENVEFVQDDGSVKYLQVTQRFNLQTKMVNGVKKLEISKHPKASFWKFLKNIEATGESLAEIRKKLIGKPVFITTTPSTKPGEEDKKYLAIVA